jgi:hypothetical protein
VIPLEPISPEAVPILKTASRQAYPLPSAPMTGSGATYPA